MDKILDCVTANIDQYLIELEKSISNKFRRHWLNVNVECVMKGENKQIPFTDLIRKIDIPGRAKCVLCNKIIK